MFEGWKQKVGGVVTLTIKDKYTDDIRVWKLNPTGTWTTKFKENITVTKKNPESIL